MFQKPSKEIDHIKHMIFPTKDKRMIVTEGQVTKLKMPGPLNKHPYLKGPQSKEGGMVTIV